MGRVNVIRIDMPAVNTIHITFVIPFYLCLRSSCSLYISELSLIPKREVKAVLVVRHSGVVRVLVMGLLIFLICHRCHTVVAC